MFELTLARHADVVQRDDNFNAAARSIGDHERRAILLVACVTAISVVSAALLLFVDDGNTTWFHAHSEMAIAAQRCNATTDGSRRHECQRELAQAAARTASSPTVLARHEACGPAELIRLQCHDRSTNHE